MRRWHAARGDCEQIRPGWVGQPVNTLSSLAFVAAAVPVWRAGARWRLVAAAAVLAGVGSVGYHGPGGPVGKALHDIGVAALAMTTAVASATDPRPPSRSAAIVGVTAGLVHLTSRTGGPLCRPDSPWQGHAAWHLLAASAVALAARG